MALTRSQEQKNLQTILRKVEEIRWLLEPLSAEKIAGAPDPEKYRAPFRISHMIGELSDLEDELRHAIQDPNDWLNMLVSDPQEWTHPWQEDSNQSLRESTGFSSTMFEVKLSLTVICKNCGADPATLNLPDEHTNESIVVCKSCRFPFGPLGELKAYFASNARRELLSNGKDISLKFYEED